MFIARLLSLLSVVLIAALSAPSRAAEPAVPDRATLERAFADMLTNATMVGKYTVTGGDDKAAKEDRYTILKAVKADGDNWVITAKIGYKGMSLPVDITVPVRWAGDTPVIQLTEQKIPGMGTFSARVMFYKDEYAGTWSAGDHGGLMFGRIERADRPATRPAAEK